MKTWDDSSHDVLLEQAFHNVFFSNAVNIFYQACHNGIKQLTSSANRNMPISTVLCELK